MPTFSKLAQALLRESPGRTVATDFRVVREWLLDAVTVETRWLVADYRVTHAVEVDEKGDVRRVLCGAAKPEEIASCRLFSVPTCPKCVHIDALPLTCVPSAKRWGNLEMRRIGADPVDRARIAAEATAQAEREARAEAARVAAEEANDERARVGRLQAAAATLCAIPAEKATAAQIARAVDLCGLLPFPHDRGIHRWRASAVEATQRRANAPRVEAAAQLGRAAHGQAASPNPTQHSTKVPPVTATHPASAMPRARPAARVDPVAPPPVRPAEQAPSIAPRSPSSSGPNRPPTSRSPVPATGAASAAANTTTKPSMTAATMSAHVGPPPDPVDRMEAMTRLLRAGPWPRPMLGKDIIRAFASNELPPGAVEALQNLVGSTAPDAVQLGRALHWVARQPPTVGVRLSCRKDRDKFSWWQVVRSPS